MSIREWSTFKKVGCGCLVLAVLSIGGCGTFVFGLFTLLKSSDAYKTGLELAQESIAVRDPRITLEIPAAEESKDGPLPTVPPRKKTKKLRPTTETPSVTAPSLDVEISSSGLLAADMLSMVSQKLTPADNQPKIRTPTIEV